MIKKIKNKKVALAYSGGLDTSVAIKWLKKKKKSIVYSIFVDLGDKSLKEKKIIKKKSILLGSNKFIILNCKKSIVKEALIALRCRAFNISSGAGIYFNITPLGRAVIGTAISKFMSYRNISIWCDGSTYKGNDIERFFIYSFRVNKKVKFYKPWLDKYFIEKMGGRREMESYINKSSRDFSIDSNVIGNTYEGLKLENLNYDYTNTSFILSKDFYKVKKVTVFSLTFKKGKIIKYNGKNIKDYCFFLNDINRICSKHKIGISDQIEERIIGLKSRGIYESPAMFLLHNSYDRIISCLLSYKCIKMYRNNGIELGEMLYNGQWYSKEAYYRKKLGLNITKIVNGYLKIKIIYNNIFYIKTKIFKKNKYNKKICSMEKQNNNAFDCNDRLGQLNILKIKIE
ncbi:argininosuccinate synthase [Candidatus Vidania fulgoroideorum]